jgi:CheY-like chemotaxis protein
MVCWADMDDLCTKTLQGYYNKSKRTFGSFDPKYYDEIITKVNLQAKEKYKHNIIQQGEGLLPNQPRNKKKVLVVDDEPDICIVYQIVLKDAGYECVSYTDSVKALQEFRSAYYDLILLDIKMPVLDGFELCKKIREIDNKIQIIFITASEEHYNKIKKQNYPELENVVSIQKPIGNEELVRVVNMAIAARG